MMLRKRNSPKAAGDICKNAKLCHGGELHFAKTLLLPMTDRLMLAGDRIVRMHG